MLRDFKHIGYASPNGHSHTLRMVNCASIVLLAAVLQGTVAWMPSASSSSSQTLSIGNLSPEQSALVQTLWTRIFFSVPDTEVDFLLQAERAGPVSPDTDGRNVTQAWEAAATVGGMPQGMVRPMPVDHVTQDDPLWEVYTQEIEHYKQYSGGVMARGSRYPEVNQKHLEAMLKKVFQHVRSDETNSDVKGSVRMYITRKFYSYSLLSLNQVFQFRPVDLQQVTAALTTGHQPLPQGAIHVENPDEPMGANVVGILPGRRWGSSQDRLLIIGAHYDTVPSSAGLDDNGSGVAAVLEAARAVTEGGCQPEFTVLFVAFDLEEVGGTGSMAFIHRFLNKKILEPSGWPVVQGAYILDTVMNYNASSQAQGGSPAWLTQMKEAMSRLDKNDGRGDFLAAIYRRQADKRLADAYAYHHARLGSGSRYRLERWDVDLPAERPSDQVLYDHFDVMRSDHSRFWYVSREVNQTEAPATIPAVLLTDTGPFRGTMARCYHAACDNAQLLLHDNPDNLPFLAHSTQALVNTLVDLSQARCTGAPLVLAAPTLPTAEGSKN